MNTKGLLRKYKLSKLSNNIVLNKFEQEICDYLDSVFSSVNGFKINNPILNVDTKWYFDKDDIFIISINNHDNFFISSIIFNMIRLILDNYTEIPNDVNDTKTIKLLTEFVEYYFDKPCKFVQIIQDTTDIYKAYNTNYFVKC